MRNWRKEYVCWAQKETGEMWIELPVISEITGKSQNVLPVEETNGGMNQIHMAANKKEKQKMQVRPAAAEKDKYCPPKLYSFLSSI